MNESYYEQETTIILTLPRGVAIMAGLFLVAIAQNKELDFELNAPGLPPALLTDAARGQLAKFGGAVLDQAEQK